MLVCSWWLGPVSEEMEELEMEMEMEMELELEKKPNPREESMVAYCLLVLVDSMYDSGTDSSSYSLVAHDSEVGENYRHYSHCPRSS